MAQSPDRNPAWVWQQIEVEAHIRARQEPVLASFYHAAILNHPDLATALAYYLAGRLGDRDVSAMLMRQVCDEAYADDPTLITDACADICAHVDRDPACDDYATPLLFLKGFHAIQAYRVSHWLWRRERLNLACYWQNRIAGVFDVDIHPAARLGHGIMLDHATGVVIGETAVLGNDISMLHGVTLGGSGRGGVRHPQVGDGVLISTGAKLLGAVHIGDGAKIAAGSVVLDDVPAFATMAGVPARVVARGTRETSPALEMNQTLEP